MIKKYIVETLDGVTQYVQTLGASDDGVFHSVMTCVNELQDAESAIEEAYNRGKAEERERKHIMSNETAKVDYEQTCKEYECRIKKMEEKMAAEKMQYKELEARNLRLEKYVEHLRGKCEGLEFAVRCNGVSGAEVN